MDFPSPIPNLRFSRNITLQKYRNQESPKKDFFIRKMHLQKVRERHRVIELVSAKERTDYRKSNAKSNSISARRYWIDKAFRSMFE